MSRGGVDERQGPLARAPAQLAQLRLLRRQLAAVATAELGEAGRVVAEPLPQLGARRELARPLVEAGVLARDAARPEPVDQHAVAVGGGRRLVGALEPHVHLVAAPRSTRARSRPGRPRGARTAG